MAIIVAMKVKSLTKTNPFLAQADRANSLVVTCVSSSTAVETGEGVKVIEAKLNRARSAKRFAVKLA